MRLVLVSFAVLLLQMTGPAVASGCRQALVFALDVSGSVDEREYQQQISGLAGALDAPEIRALLLNRSAPPVEIAVFEWSSRNHQYLILPWTRLDTQQTVDRAVARIRDHRKIRAGLKTALGTALEFANTMLLAKPDCWRRTIDVSGDGENNIGRLPAGVFQDPAFAGVTVNALVVGDPEPDVGTPDGGPELLRYFEQEVIHGPGAFAILALGYGDYLRAMKVKLEREVSVPTVSYRHSD